MGFDLFGDSTGLPETTRSKIKYEIDALSYREQWVEGANQTTVVCRVRAMDWVTWVEDMVGRVYLGSEEEEVDGETFSINVLRRDLPEQNPFYPNQWCIRVEQVDQGESPDDSEHALPVTPGTFADPVNGWPVTMWMRAKVIFQGLPFTLKTDAEVDAAFEEDEDEPELLRYLERRQQVIVREQGFPAGAYKIVGTEEPLPQTAFKMRAQGEVLYFLHRWPVEAIPYTAIYDLLGKINDDEFDPDENDNGWPTGTLAFAGFDTNQKMWDQNGTFCCMPLILRFRFMEGGWNFFLDREARLVEVSLTGTSDGDKPYEFGDFNRLFRAEP